MYELLIRLYNDLDYKKYTIEELKEMEEILKCFDDKVCEVKLRKERVDVKSK